MNIQIGERSKIVFRKIKDCNLAFKNLGTEKKCDPSKLKDFFEQHFNN